MFSVAFVLMTEVTCVPVGRPIPDRGAPMGGSAEAGCTPSLVVPCGLDPFVWKLPEAPLVTTLNIGLVPIAAPV